MVFIVQSCNADYYIYYGKDKYENEELIKYGFPIDVWFHADNLSSRHVYVRLPEGVGIDDIDADVLNEVCQLVKDGSKEGRKKPKISVCYTMWENLKKTSNMEIGEVGFVDDKKIKVIHNITKNAELLKKLYKVTQERIIDYAEEKDNYNKEVINKNKKIEEERRKKEQEEIRKQREISKDKRFEFMDKIGSETSNKADVDLDEDFW